MPQNTACQQLLNYIGICCVDGSSKEPIFLLLGVTMYLQPGVRRPCNTLSTMSLAFLTGSRAIPLFTIPRMSSNGRWVGCAEHKVFILRGDGSGVVDWSRSMQAHQPEKHFLGCSRVEDHTQHFYTNIKLRESKFSI